jgi:hypothetical protein
LRRRFEERMTAMRNPGGSAWGLQNTQGGRGRSRIGRSNEVTS